MRCLLAVSIVLLASAIVEAKTVPTLLVVEASQQAAAEAAMIDVCGHMAVGTFTVERTGPGKTKYFVASGSWMTAQQLAAWSAALKNHISTKRVQIFEAVKGRDKLKELKIAKPTNQ